MAEGISIISRPGDDPDPEGVDDVVIISRPKPKMAPETAQGFIQRAMGHYNQNVDQGIASMREGGSRVVAPGVSPWERTKGAGQAAMGALQYAGSPIEAASQTLVGDPVRTLTGSQMAGDSANLIAQLLGGVGAARTLPRAVAAAPEAIRRAATAMPGAVNKAATATGGVLRDTVNTVDDVIKNQLSQAERRTAERAANAAPTKDALTTEKNAKYKAAFEKGGVMTEGEYANFVDNVTKVASENRLKLKDTLTPQAKALSDNLETYRGRPLTLEDLDDLLQENRDFVAKAASEAKNTNQRRDLAAAQTLAKSIRDMVYKWEPQGGTPEAVETFKQAKELARRTIKMRSIEEIIDVAQRLGDPDEVQRAFRAISKDPLEYGSFSAAEKKLIDELAQPTLLEKAGDVPVIGKVPALAEKAGRVVRGANAGGRLTKAKELIDLIARGEKFQADEAAKAAAKPSAAQRINDVLRPEPPNSRNRRINPKQPPGGVPGGELPADSPARLSLSDFKAAAERGVIGPAEKPGFTRIQREQLPDDYPQEIAELVRKVNARELAVTPEIKTRIAENAKRLLPHHNRGLNNGYATDDVARHQVHTWALYNIPEYRAAVTAGKNPPIPERAFKAAYDQLQSEIKGSANKKIQDLLK